MSFLNKAVYTLILSFLLFASTSSFAQKPASDEQLQIEAKQKIQHFAKTLKASLTSAIKAGGLEAGVEVCSKQAQAIANSLSTDGWQVSRISLKPRNPANTPSTWQQIVLERFEAQMVEGKPVADLVFKTQDKSTFSLIKAIPTGELCLKCHGSAIAPEVRQTIKRYYPKDQATGFAVGDIRGAFVVEKAR